MGTDDDDTVGVAVGVAVAVVVGVAVAVAVGVGVAVAVAVGVVVAVVVAVAVGVAAAVAVAVAVAVAAAGEECEPMKRSSRELLKSWWYQCSLTHDGPPRCGPRKEAALRRLRRRRVRIWDRARHAFETDDMPTFLRLNNRLERHL